MAKILLAEDDMQLSESLTEIIQLDGHSVRIARDGETAWGMLQQEYFDFLITDYTMPMLDGEALLSNIEHTPDLDHLKVIIISGRDVDMPLSDVRVPLLLRKPFDVTRILDALKQDP